MVVFAMALPGSGFSQTPVPVDLGQDTSICGNETLLLDATFANATYLWSTGATTPTVIVPFGTYSVTVTDTTGAFTPGVDSIEISPLNIPPVAVNPSGDVSLCDGDSVRLMGSGGGMSVWYLNGVALPGPHTNVYWAKVPGSYNMTKTNMNGCTDSAQVAADVSQIDAVMGGWTADKDTVDLSVSGAVSFTDNSTNATAWEWDFGDGNTSTDQNPVHNYTMAGNYTVMQVAMNPGCNDTVVGVIVAEGIVANDPFANWEEMVQVYPNPASEILNVEVTAREKIRFEIVSLLGVTALERTLSPGVHRLPLGDLAPGVYVYRLTLENGASYQRK